MSRFPSRARLLTIAAACVAGSSCAVAPLASGPAKSGPPSQVLISTANGPADGFTVADSATVNISASGRAPMVVKVNGVDVTKAFSQTAEGLTGAVTALKPGPNLVTVSSGKGRLIEYAHRTITRGVPLKAGCSSLVGMAIPAAAIKEPTRGATVTAAVEIATVTSPVVTNGVVQLPTPAYCQVRGAIAPVDPAAPAINFQIDLPAAWNEKIAQMGGSGFNGVIPAALTGAAMRNGPESIPPDAPYAITRGFVAYGSDSGHQTGSAWALNKEAFANYGYLQVKKTHDVALQVVKAAYGLDPRKSYFFGSSTGGREALQAAQRYPDDYDGILSQVPVIAWPELTTYQSIRDRQAQLGAGWIPPAKVTAIDTEVRRQCDALDGLVDGYIGDTFICNQRFDPQLVANPYAAIRCPGGADTGNDCLSDPQIATLNLFHSPTKYAFSLGYTIDGFPGWEVGGESASNGPYSRTQPTLAAANAPDAFLIATTGSMTINSLVFKPEDYPAGVQYVASTVYATNPDLSRFAARGGKLILKSNSTDYTASPNLITQYFQSVVRALGQAKVDQFMRYYVATGPSHNGNIGVNTVTGQTAPYYVDLIAMVDNWSEDGAPPSDSPTVTFQDRTPPFALKASLPMCRYPTTPHYVSGDTARAASYACH
ncbi:MAG: tannase/feruloyl esterase family alpha/beta hydrolase [Caulobacteraceae bacterium]|nr:tannase/feruloyl esterase family alpha/beta hydrolase [Caulobacteraceae bacterium]